MRGAGPRRYNRCSERGPLAAVDGLIRRPSRDVTPPGLRTVQGAPLLLTPVLLGHPGCKEQEVKPATTVAVVRRLLCLRCARRQAGLRREPAWRRPQWHHEGAPVA